MPSARRLFPSFLIILGCLLAPGAIGCSCSTDDSQAKLEDLKKKLEEEKKKKAKPKRDYDVKPLTIQPDNLVDRQFYVKPGHWATGSVECVANNFDVKGDLTTDPLDLDGIPFSLGTVRSANLPKGQVKPLEVMLNYPELISGVDRSDVKGFSVRLNSDGGRALESSPAVLTRMPAHQFFFCVLANDPDRYRYLGQMPMMRPATSTTRVDEQDAFYRLVLPHVIRRSPLPTMTFGWTQMAYLVWDDVPVGIVTAEQQEAMLDWLHWGGQIIVSGPGSLNLLKQSFLEPYLPAISTGEVELTEDNLGNMRFAEGAGWGLPKKVGKPWACEILQPAPDARVLATAPAVTKDSQSIQAPLIVERMIGRGRIVVTAFRLTQPELNDWRFAWPGWDAIANGFLLRRKPRNYTVAGDSDTALFEWRADGRLMIAQTPNEASRLRYFARDVGAGSHKPDWLRGRPRPQREVDEFGNPVLFDDADMYRFQGPGPAAWDDWSDVAYLARTSLEDAAGIKVPERTFVLQTLGWYLLFLVPINWALFGMIRRLEWAWVAAPLITITFTVLVVRWAELNIGFARSRTEVGFVEVFGEHERAHLARYTALYTSLSTRYEARINDRGGVVLPLSGREQLQTFQLASRSTLWLRRDDQAVLTGYDVASNTRGMLHGEQMFKLGGPIKVLELSDERVKIRNESDYVLRDAEVIGPRGIAKLGTLEPEMERMADFKAPPPKVDPRNEGEEPEGEPAKTETRSPSELIKINSLLDLARKTEDDSVRLVAWSDEALPGLEVFPAASQNRHANVFLVHLRPATLGKAAPDIFREDAEQAFLKRPTKGAELIDPSGGSLEDALKGLDNNR